MLIFIKCFKFLSCFWHFIFWLMFCVVKCTQLYSIAHFVPPPNQEVSTQIGLTGRVLKIPVVIEPWVCFQEAVKENARRKELEEKQRRAKLAKEQAQREKEERKRKRQPVGVDLNAGMFHIPHLYSALFNISD